MRIIGIDPGYAIMGWAVLDLEGNHFKAVDYGVVTTDAGVPMSLRLQHLYAELLAIIGQYKPGEAGIEELFFNTNAKTAIGVGEARGVAMLAGRSFVLPDDVQKMAKHVLCHRMIMRNRAGLHRQTPEAVIDDILNSLPVPAVR